MRTVLFIALALAAGCGVLTREEAAEAAQEIEVASSAAALTSSSVELSTNFTIGDRVEAAAEELRSFIESQLPCAEVTLEGSTLTTVYGARPGACVYRGQTYSGTHSVSVMRNEMAEVLVHHTWTEFQNQRVAVTGEAMVTWSFADRTRRVVHEATWTRLRDGRTGVGSGDRVQRALDEGILTGFRVSGDHDWSGEAGDWHLDIEDVEMRWVDAVPQSGRYRLDTPFDKSVAVEFVRSSGTTITVIVTSGTKEYRFDVTTLPDA